MMGLSPEDRERIYEEEKARKEAQERLKHEEATAKQEADKKNVNKARLGCLSIIAVLLAIVVIGTLRGHGGQELLAQTGVFCAPAPDEDDSTLYDMPRPPMPSQFLRWRASHTQAAFLYDHKTGGWRFLAFQDSDRKYQIDINEAKKRLCR